MPEGQGKIKGMAKSANSCAHSSVVSTSDRGGTALTSGGSGLSKSSSVSSSSSEKSNLNPHAKASSLKLSFSPLQKKLSFKCLFPVKIYIHRVYCCISG